MIDNEDSPPPSPNPRRSQRQKEKANKDDDKSDDNAQVEFLAPRCFSFMVSSNVTWVLSPGVHEYSSEMKHFKSCFIVLSA